MCLTLSALLLVVTACKPSAQELARRAEEADAAERARAHADTLKRKADFEAAASAQAKKWARPSEPEYCNVVTAERAIKRMGSCGIDVSGSTPDGMCRKMGQKKLLYVASRSCAELMEIVAGAGD